MCRQICLMTSGFDTYLNLHTAVALTPVPLTLSHLARVPLTLNPHTAVRRIPLVANTRARTRTHAHTPPTPARAALLLMNRIGAGTYDCPCRKLQRAGERCTGLLNLKEPQSRYAAAQSCGSRCFASQECVGVAMCCDASCARGRTCFRCVRRRRVLWDGEGTYPLSVAFASFLALPNFAFFDAELCCSTLRLATT